ncbi:MAG: hypothetical protein ACI8ZO_000706 [Flavobacteriales bacterium]|jgi:hypothetical protein
MKLFKLLSLTVCIGSMVNAQKPEDRWQQKVNYQMEIDFNVETNQFTGTQKLTYTNNSPETLDKVFYHLYFNAFQPGSMMDVRSRTIADPDRRVKDRILHLKEDEIGYHNIISLTQNGKPLNYEVVGTVLEVELATPIRPGKKANFEMEFESQVPLQVRRSGRDNKENIRYSMTQWYPKMAEYDFEGWHANPYIAREFHGVWGDFDVKINIDKSYTIGGTGYLQNAKEIGKGYYPSEVVSKESSDKLTWHFKAPNVHDFAWAADPDYIHTTAQVENGPLLHFIYQPDSLTQYWDSLPKYAVQVFELMAEHFGAYPYKQYTVIQGGDGGMEYPMATLITGHRGKNSLIGVTAHEAIHSWYQMMLASNEAKHPWMDEGFTSYAEDEVLSKIWDYTPHQGSYRGYVSLVKSGKQEPMTTHSDHYKTNRAYGTNAYSKGALTVSQLEYVLGKEDVSKAMKEYFMKWKFKHPNPNDFKRVMEQVSGIELDWYFEHWIGTTNNIDYNIKNIISDANSTTITLERIGDMPMPLDILIEFADGTKELHNIPMRIMRGSKSSYAEYDDTKITQDADWPWTYPYYDLKIGKAANQIANITIDPLLKMVDIDRSNNSYPNDKSRTYSND